jgi:hypothetical protein
VGYPRTQHEGNAAMEHVSLYFHTVTKTIRSSVLNEHWLQQIDDVTVVIMFLYKQV